jgi:electron transport complex protein RnfD
MTLRKAPFRYGSQKTKTMMWLIQAALLVNLLSSTVLFTLAGFEGWRLLVSAGVAIVVGVVVEFMFYRSWKRPQSILALLLRKQSAMIPMMVALLLPLHVPLYLVAVSTLVSVWIAKLVFGGFGNSIFQNATVGVLFAYVSFGPQIALTPALIGQGVSYPIDVLKNALFNNTTSGLDVMALFVGGEYYTIAAGAMSGLVLVGIWVVLSLTKTIDWILGATYLASVFTISTIVGGTALGFEMLVTGMVLFAAVFLVSDPVTSPTTRNTKLLYAVIVAVVTVMIRVLGNNTEGVLFAILIGNVVTPYMNRNARSGSLRTLIQTTAIAMVLTVAAGFIILQVSQPATEEVAVSTEVLIHETL